MQTLFLGRATPRGGFQITQAGFQITQADANTPVIEAKPPPLPLRRFESPRLVLHGTFLA